MTSLYNISNNICALQGHLKTSNQYEESEFIERCNFLCQCIMNHKCLTGPWFGTIFFFFFLWIRLYQNAKNCLGSCRIEPIDKDYAQNLVPNLCLPFNSAFYMPEAVNIHPQRYLEVCRNNSLIFEFEWISVTQCFSLSLSNGKIILLDTLLSM